MPELLVYARALLLGLALAEVFRLSFYLGERFAPSLAGADGRVVGFAGAACLAILATYILKRGGFAASIQLARSLRVDLLLTAALGAWANNIAAPLVGSIHAAFKSASPHWAPMVLAALLIILAATLARATRRAKGGADAQPHFMSDVEITEAGEDTLAVEAQAEAFAETVIACAAQPGMVFGVDGPWGAGKTSFVNLAHRHWSAKAAESLIVVRFEPLRYATDPDLTDRLISELTSAIQREAFAPELKPAASRYSRMLKGKAEFTFLGFKLSLEPSSETLDELLATIDELLERIGRRVIIVVDDLDRLEPSAVNGVLFTVRRALRLSRVIYVLCYDTEVLAGGKAEPDLARQFLEKFVTAKLNLLVDASALSAFLRKDWKRDEGNLNRSPQARCSSSPPCSRSSRAFLMGRRQPATCL